MNTIEEQWIKNELKGYEKSLIEEIDQYDRQKIISFLQKQGKLDLWNKLVPKDFSEIFLWNKIIKLKYELKKQYKKNKDKDGNKIKNDDQLFKDTYYEIFKYKKIKYRKQKSIYIPGLMSLVGSLLQLVKVNKENIKMLVEEKRNELKTNLIEKFDYQLNAKKIIEREFGHYIIDDLDILAKEKISPEFIFSDCINAMKKKIFNDHKYLFSIKKEDLEYYLDLFLTSRYNRNGDVINQKI